MPVRLFVALRGEDADLLRRARQLLSRRYGAIDVECAWEVETGAAGAGLLLSFEFAQTPGRLVELVHDTYAVEEEITNDCLLPDDAPPVQSFPGYVDVAKIVLGTTRDGPQRLFVGSSVYAEIALARAGEHWTLAGTAGPEWIAPSAIAFFDAVRARLIVTRDQRGAPEQSAAST